MLTVDQRFIVVETFSSNKPLICGKTLKGTPGKRKPRNKRDRSSAQAIESVNLNNLGAATPQKKRARMDKSIASTEIVIKRVTKSSFGRLSQTCTKICAEKPFTTLNVEKKNKEEAKKVPESTPESRIEHSGPLVHCVCDDRLCGKVHFRYAGPKMAVDEVSRS